MGRIRAVFLFGGAEEIIKDWHGKPSEMERIAGPLKIFKDDPYELFYGAIGERKRQKRIFFFLFITLNPEDVDLVPQILKRAGISWKDATAIFMEKPEMTPSKRMRQRSIAEKIAQEPISKKRYYEGKGCCRWTIYLRGKADSRTIQELAATLFSNYDLEKKKGRLFEAIKRKGTS